MEMERLEKAAAETQDLAEKAKLQKRAAEKR
jgi:hypothetical protein